METQEKSVKLRWLRLVVGAIIMLFLGLIYSWSVFVTPLEQTYGWSRSSTAFTFTLSIVFFVLGLLLAGWLVGKLPRQTLMVAAGALLALGFWQCGNIRTLGQLYIFYGVCIGLGVGIANNVLVSSVVAWFPQRRGFASGVLMMGFGLGGLFLSGGTQVLLSHLGWQPVFRIFSVVFGLVIACGAFVVSLPKEEDLAALSATGSSLRTATGPFASQQNFRVSQVLRQSSFWWYLAWFALIMAGGLLIIGHSALFAVDIAMSPGIGALAAGFLSLFNGIGRVLFGIVYDKKGLRTGMRGMNLLLFSGALFLLLALWRGSIPLLLVGYLFTGLSYGGGPTTSSIFASTYYGPEHFAINYGAVSLGMIPGALLGPFLSGFLRDSTGGYTAALVCMLAFSVVSWLVLLQIKSPERCLN